jgi:ATP-dependent Clp protease protease subunit
MYVQHTGQSLEVIEQAMERDKFMSATEAKEFGLIDEVVNRRAPKEGEGDKE